MDTADDNQEPCISSSKVCPEVTLYKQYLASDSTCLQFEDSVAVDLMDSASVDQNDRHHVVLDRTLTVDHGHWLNAHCSVIAARWSPAALDSEGRSILASIQRDHRLCIHGYSSQEHEWKTISDLSVMYESIQKQDSFNNIGKFLPDGIKNKHLQETYAHLYALAAVDLCWFPVFATCANSNSDLSHLLPSSKAAHLKNDETRYALLAVAMKNGSVVFWRMSVPTLASGNVSFVMTTNLDYGQPTCISWTNLQRYDNTGLLALGVHSGKVIIIETVLIDEDNLMLSDPVEVWEDEDKMSPSCMAWSTWKGQPLLLVTKCQFITAHLFSCDADGAYHCSFTTHIHGNNFVESTGLTCYQISDTPVFYMSSGDGLLQKIHINPVENTTDLCLLTSSIPTPFTTTYRWFIHGVCVSQNGGLVMMAGSPSSKYDHLLLREILQVYVVCDISESLDTLVNHLISSSPPSSASMSIRASSLRNYNDVLECCRQQIMRGLKLPPVITDLLAAKEEWSKLTITVTQFLRYILCCLLSSLSAKDKDNTHKEQQALQLDIQAMTDIILSAHVEKCLSTYLSPTTVRKLTDTELNVLWQMCSWAETQSSNPLTKNLTQPCSRIQNIIKGSKTRKKIVCEICGKSLQFQADNWGSISCEDKHTFAICGHSFMPCTGASHRKCIVCGHLYLTTKNINKTLPWMSDEFVIHCVLCDDLLS